MLLLTELQAVGILSRGTVFVSMGTGRLYLLQIIVVESSNEISTNLLIYQIREHGGFLPIFSC
jgi:hypothetical protein